MLTTSPEKLDKIRKLGRDKFVLRYGILGWGLSTAILFTLFLGFTEGWDDFAFKLIPALIIFPLGGFGWGRLMWAFFERMNKRALSE